MLFKFKFNINLYLIFSAVSLITTHPRKVAVDMQHTRLSVHGKWITKYRLLIKCCLIFLSAVYFYTIHPRKVAADILCALLFAPGKWVYGLAGRVYSPTILEKVLGQLNTMY